MGKIERLPRSKEHPFQPPLLDLRTDFPLRSTVTSCKYILTHNLSFFHKKKNLSKEQLYVFAPSKAKHI